MRSEPEECRWCGASLYCTSGYCSKCGDQRENERVDASETTGEAMRDADLDNFYGN